MGSFYGAAVWLSIGLFILNDITPITGLNKKGLYRDGGIGIIKISCGTNIRKIKKCILKKISSIGFKNTIDIGNTSTKFLNVSLDLIISNYHLYGKPNSKTIYINVI